MIKVKNQKWIETDDGKIFNIGDDIGFDYYDEKIGKPIRVICEIMGITENIILGRNVEINESSHKKYGEFRMNNISNAKYVYYD